MSDTQLQKIESQTPGRVAPSVADMLQAVIEKGVSSENVGALEKLVGLYEHMQEKDAERQFAEAFNALQSEMKVVKAMKPVPNNDGSVRYRFAPFEEIMAQVRPLLERHRFTVSFSTDFSEGRIFKICTLQHIGGHSKSNRFGVRIGKGPPAALCALDTFCSCDALLCIRK